MSEAKIDLNNLDKSNWKTYRFDEIANNISERVDPNNTDLTVYIGLEHIDSESLHIKRHGTPDDVNGTKLKFYKGDIIFGRRRAYQRKAGIATWDGFCSAHALVLRANPDVIDPDLFPFFMHSDLFMNRAIDISVGSLSPTINWGTLKHQEFLIPPIEMQKDFIELFRGSTDLINSQHVAQKSANVFFQVQNNSAVLRGKEKELEYSKAIKEEKAKKWRLTTIGELLKEGAITQIQDGNHGEIHPKSSDYVDDGVPFVMANILNNGEVDLSASKKLPKALTDKLRVGFSLPGDLLLSHKGTVGEVAIVPDEIDWPYLMLTPQVTYYRINTNKISREFLYFVFTSGYFQKQLMRLSSQSTRAYVGITAQKNLKVVIPSTKEEQEEIVDILLSTRRTISCINSNNYSTKSLQSQLINKVF